MKCYEVRDYYLHRFDQNGKPIAKYTIISQSWLKGIFEARKKFFTDFSVPWYKRCLYHTTDIPCGVVDAKNFK